MSGGIAAHAFAADGRHDIVVGEGTYEVTGLRGPDGKPAPPVKGHYVNTTVKKNGAWLLASNAGVPPPCPPPTPAK